MKLQLLAVPLLMALILSPMFAAAATGSIAFSSPAAGSSFKMTSAYTITGTITPVPTLPDNVVITVTLQGGSPSPLDEQTVAVGAGGTFSYATNVGGSAAWVTGTYVISAFDSNGATGTTTFTYTAGTPTPSTATGYVTIEGPSIVLPGNPANIWIYSSAPGIVTAWVLPAGSTTTTAITAARVTPNPGGLYIYSATYSVAAGAANGVYLVGASVTNASTNPAFGASNIGSFTVNGGIATAANQATILTDLTTLTTSVTALQTSLTGVTGSISSLGKNVTTTTSDLASINSGITSINTAITSLQGSVSTLSTNVGTISTAVSGLTTSVAGLQTSLSSLTSTTNGISSSLTSLTNNVASLQSSVASITSGISSIQSSVSTLSGLSGQMTTLSGQVTSLQNSLSTTNSDVSNAQTYILVVAALAVITLVLELAILIRKMS
jgi:trimeric autotransporter adhesin